MRVEHVLRGCAGILILGLVGTSVAVYATSAGSCTGQPESNVGCEFYAVSLPNPILDQATFHFGVALMNAGTTSASVSVSGFGLAIPNVFNVGPGSAVTTLLPWVSNISTSSSTVKVVGGAYHIASTQPVSALQLNAVEPQIAGTFSQTNDASLLLPVQSAGTSFRAVVWPTWNGGSAYPGYIVIVSTASANTVQIAAPGAIQPGAGLNANGGNVSLDQGDVLLVSSALVAGSDLSGTLITSSAPVLVWSGHDAADVPEGTGFADHLEETLPPISALDNEYFIVRPGNPSGSASGAKHYVKIVGTADGTTLSTDPAIGGAPAALQAGQTFSFEATSDFHLQSTMPIMVGLFMEGSTSPGFDGHGDPSQSIPVSARQVRRSIDFIAPASLAPIFAQVIAPTGTAVSVDSSAVSGWSSIGSSGYSAANVALCCTDAHHATGDQPFSLSVYAYPPTGTSYWYPGSLGIGDDIFRDGFE